MSPLRAGGDPADIGEQRVVDDVVDVTEASCHVNVAPGFGQRARDRQGGAPHFSRQAVALVTRKRLACKDMKAEKQVVFALPRNQRAIERRCCHAPVVARAVPVWAEGRDGRSAKPS
jgi:hypothetical protein